VASSDILDLDATAQLQALAAGEVSGVELLQACVARHQRLKSQLNAVVAKDVEAATARALEIDQQRARGEMLGPLAGLPMTVKDTFDVEGLPASSGLAQFLGREVDDAEVVANARAAGAVIWGKTNVPVLAGDFQTYNRLYGTTNNPWDLERTPGGSSGGAAAALATGITALEIGSDIGGSLRTPASFCGVFSHKPTWGRISQRGHIPPAPGVFEDRDLNVIGPMARSARDLRLLFPIIEGEAPGLATATLKGLRIGLWTEDPAFIVDAEVRAVVEAFAERLEEAGAVVQPMVPVDSRALLDSYATLLAAILRDDMPAKTLSSMAWGRPAARVAKAFGAGPLSAASMVLRYTATDAELARADSARQGLAHQLAGGFEQVDVILAPVNPVTAFPHDHRAFARRKLTCSGGQQIPGLTMLQWISLASALGLPATAIPAGLTNTGLPVGAQLIGPRGADERTLAIAQAMEDELGPLFVAPPPVGL